MCFYLFEIGVFLEESLERKHLLNVHGLMYRDEFAHKCTARLAKVNIFSDSEILLAEIHITCFSAV